MAETAGCAQAYGCDGGCLVGLKGVVPPQVRSLNTNDDEGGLSLAGEEGE